MKRRYQLKSRTDKPSVSELMSRFLDTPGDLISGMTLEMRGRNELLVCGCLEITEYGTEKIRVILRCGELCISGRRLTMSSFSDGRITVCGSIDGVFFIGSGECDGNE